jgi:LPS-assembly lipoprotein
MPSYLNAAVLGVLLVLLGGCGFKLRGQAQLPPELAVTYLKAYRPPGAQPGDLPAALERSLVANGVKVTAEPQSATATLEILQEAVRSRALAAGSRESTAKGEIREYALQFDVTYQVTLADGKKLIPPQTLSASRNMLYDESKVLGRAAGEEILIRDMVNDIARSIILRLQAAVR